MHVLITGGFRGIGLETALELQRRLPTYLRLTITGRDSVTLANAEQQLRAAGAEAVLATVSDVSDARAVEQTVREATQAFGEVDVLINNAGFGRFGPVKTMSAETFDEVLATDLRGPFLITQAVIGSMVRRKHGVVITVSSVAGRQGYRNGGAYCAAKHGVSGLMRSLAAEVREHGVRVSTIFPGNVETDFFRTAGFAQNPPKMLKARDVAQMIVQTIELPAGASVEEILIRPT